MERLKEFEKYNIAVIMGKSPKNGKPTAIGIKKTPKMQREKIIFNYYFATEQRREEFLSSYLAKEIESSKRKEVAKQERKEKNATLQASDYFKVGEIVVNTWGYEQTNVEFYQILGVLNKTLIVREIYQKADGDYYPHGMACNVLPEKNNFITDKKEFRLRLKSVSWQSAPVICNPQSYYYFHKWDGRPQYNSWYN